MDSGLRGRLLTPAGLPHAGPLITISGALFVAITAVVYFTGGTAYSWPYLMLIPVILCGAGFGVWGGLIGGLIGGLLLGPFMPLNVGLETMQSTSNWVARVCFYIGLGGFVGWLFTHLRAAAARQHELTRTDTETGLANQVALEEDVAARAATGSGGRHTEDRQSTAMVLLRAVDMGEALEAIGGDAGAHIVPALAERFREADARVVGVYRFSTSEIAVILDNAEAGDLEEVAARLREMAEAPIPVRGIPVCLELVSGAARADTDWVDGQALIRRARIALNAALEHHHSGEIYEQTLENVASETVRLVAQLRSGLTNGEMALYYQPKIRLATGEPAGCESLIRWISPESGVVPPAQFMPKIERTSFINPITEFVTDTACRVACDEPDFRPVSVNLSSRNLFDRQLMDHIGDLLARSGLNAEHFEIEITERALIRNPGHAASLIARLRELGVRVSIDDFGTGYSSLQYLRDLPVTGLKIDRVFVQGLEENQRARDLLSCIIDAGHALGMEVTAEGVETPGQVMIAHRLGCDIAQGFYFARPMPMETYRRWVADWTPESCPVAE
jgi:EAL domain-containing protein (putative c-di-GMP-specific phosphodiesterase class I)/GGDEF domain-containing protein